MNAFRPYAESHYREDLPGLRACAVLLIIVYQIWIDRESGGIDAVFVISGFLMGSVLLRQYCQEESLRPFHFWAGIIKRVAPPAYLVLMATFVLGPFLLPPAGWRAAIDDLLLSAVQMENFQLIRNDSAPLQPALHNPFQHFWALSMQAQFYLLLPLLMGPAMFLSRVLYSRWPMILGVVLIILVSFAYSVSATHGHPASAYFHTAARLWEFFTGVLLALLLPLLQVGQHGSWVLAAVGLVLLLGTGLFMSPQAPFPGVAALVPVIATALLIMAGARRGRHTRITRLLAHRHLVYLGKASLAIYLWHWPLLIVAHQYYATTTLGLAQGVLVIGATLALAILTLEIVESPFRRLPKSKPWRAYIVGIVFFAPVFAAWVGAKHHVLSVERAARHNASQVTEPYVSGPTLHPRNNARSQPPERFHLEETDRGTQPLDRP